MTKQTLFTQKDCVPLPSDLVGEILVLRTDFSLTNTSVPNISLYISNTIIKSLIMFSAVSLSTEKNRTISRQTL